MRRLLVTIVNSLWVLGILTIASCGKEETRARLGFSVDGSPQKVQTYDAILESQVQNGHDGVALYISVVTEGAKLMTLTVANWDFQSPPTNSIIAAVYDATFDYVDSDTDNPNETCVFKPGNKYLCSGANVSYLVGADLYTSILPPVPDATITITTCDASNKLVSGSFQALLANADGVEVTVSGSFDNVKYVPQ